MKTKFKYRMEFNGFRSEVSDFLFAIPDGWVVSGRLTLPPDKEISRKQILPTAGYLYSRHYPFPMMISSSESQKDRDHDLALLASRTAPGDLGPRSGGDWKTTVPGFVEWVEYGAGTAVSLHYTKMEIFGWYKNGYEGRIVATRFVDGNFLGEKIAETKFHLVDDLRQVEIELDFFPPNGTQESIDPFIDALRRNSWRELEEAIA